MVLLKFLVRIRGYCFVRCYFLSLTVPHWKAQFGKLCVSEVVAGILTARPPKYSVIVDLDRKIRDMELPQYALDPPPDDAPFSVVMQHFMPGNYRCLSASQFSLSMSLPRN
jgi:hypothetical protein